MTEKQKTLVEAEVVEGVQVQPVGDEKSLVPRDDVLDLMQRALDGKSSVDVLEKLVAMKYEEQRRQGIVAFNVALMEAKAEFPPLKHNRTAKIATRAGSDYAYTYCDLPYLDRTLSPILHKHGFNYRWDTNPAEDGSETVIFILEHVGGHKIESRFRSKIEGAAKMSATQKIEAANTTAKRRSMTQGLGITDDAQDNDTATGVDASATLDDDQYDQICAVLDELKEARPDDFDRFLSKLCATFGVKTVREMHPENFVPAMAMLKGKRK